MNPLTPSFMTCNPCQNRDFDFIPHSPEDRQFLLLVAYDRSRVPKRPVQPNTHAREDGTPLLGIATYCYQVTKMNFSYVFHQALRVLGAHIHAHFFHYLNGYGLTALGSSPAL